MKKVYRNYLFLLLIICQCGWIIVEKKTVKSIENGILNESEKEVEKDKNKKEKADPKSNRRNKKTRRLIANVSTLSRKNVILSDVAEKSLPAIVAPPAPIYEANMPQEENEYYKYDFFAKTFKKSESVDNIFGFDPVKFRLNVDKDSVNVGEEFEITIIAEFLDVTPTQMFQFEGSNEFTLKALLSQEFVQTGGTYFDFINGKVSRESPRQEFTIKGYYKDFASTEIKLLRGHKDASSGDVFLLKLKKTSIIAFKNASEYVSLTNPISERINTVNVGCGVGVAVCLDYGVDEVSGFVWEQVLNASGVLKVKKRSSSEFITVTANTDNDFIKTVRLLDYAVFFKFKQAGEYDSQIEITCPSGSKSIINLIQRISETSKMQMSVLNVPTSSVKPGTPITVTVNCSRASNGFFSTYDYSIKPQETTTYTVECIDCTKLPYSFTVNVDNSCESLSPPNVPKPAKIINKGDVALNASGCTSGTVTWEWGEGNTATGHSISAYITTTTTFYAYCIKDNCKSEKFSVVADVEDVEECTIPPVPEIAETSPVSIPSGQETVTLSVSNSALCTGTLKWSNGSTGSSITVSSTGKYYVKCVKSDCESTNSSEVTVQACTAPIAPRLTSSPSEFNDGGGDGTLYANGCLGKVTWDNNLGEGYNKAISISTNTTFKATCTVDNCISSETSITVPVSCNAATTPIISVVSTTAASTTIQATNCNGLVVWNNDLNQTGTTKVIIDGGNYFATCRVGICESGKSETLYLGGKCGNYEIWAYSNANANPGSVTIGDNLVLHSGVTGRPDSEYYFAWYYGETQISGPNSSPTFTVAKASNSGTYTVHVRRLGTETVCTKSFNVNIAPCNLNVIASWKKEDGNLHFSVWANKDLTGATYHWNLPYGDHKTTPSFSVPADNQYKGNYNVTVTLNNCSVVSVLNNIDFDANPNYNGSVEYAWCDFIKGRVEDKANPRKNVKVKLYIDGVLSGSTTAANKMFEFSLNESYKDGNPHEIIVKYDTPGFSTDNTAIDAPKTITCCKLEFTGENPVEPGCDILYNKGKVAVSFRRTTPTSTVSYRLLKKFYNETQQVYYEPIGDWKIIAGSTNTTFEINNLEDGHYKIELREGTINPCFINAIFTIDCKLPIAGCKLPNIIITPSDTIREGIGIIPTLYADFVGTSGLINTNTNNNNNLGKGYYLNGNSAINLTAIDSKSNFTFEAWIKPDENIVTTVGFIGDGEKHRYLIQSVYETGTRFKLSAGANGFTLIEELLENGNHYKRVALSYENSILGLNHIALVYQDNLPKLYLNGNLVATAAQTIQDKYNLSPGNSNNVLAGRQVGFHSNMGFKGYIDEIRGWNTARSQGDIQSKKDSKRDTEVINSASIQGYWTFNAGDGLKNLKYEAELAKPEGASEVDLATFPTYSVPELKWYVGNIQVGTGLKHVMADSLIRADGITYTVKYTGANGAACQTTKTVTIKRAIQNTLSGCFYISPNYETNRKVHFAKEGGTPRLFNTRTNVGEDGIWKFEHDANGIYRIILPYDEQLVTNGINGVQLDTRTTNQQNQLWKFKFIDSLSQNPTIKIQSRSNNQFLTSNGNMVYLNLSADAGVTANSQIFKLEKTTCPVPPKPCITDGQITIEKITGISAATTTYLEQNDDLLSAYIDKFRGSGKTVNKWGTNTTRINFTNSIPTNDVRTDNFVVRLTGYFCAPSTGEFVFGLVGVDKSQLFVSPSEDERTKARLVKNTSTIGWDSWTDANRAKYYMTQNRTYYVEATMLVNAATSEYLKLGISGPGITDNGSADQGVFLQHFSSSPRDKKPARIRDDSEACGKVPAGPLVSDDLPFLIKGDTIFAGDFKVIVDAVTGANGTFSGTGTAKVKYMFDTPIKVRFDGVQVNDYYDLVSGEITTEYDKDWNNVMDVDTLIKDVIASFKNFAEGADKLCKFDSDKYSGKALNSMEKAFFDAAAKEIDDALASQYRSLYTSMQTQMNIIDANRAACRAIPPDQTACTNINNAKSTLTTLQTNVCSLETQRSGDINTVVNIIQLALNKIKTLDTYNSTDAKVSTFLIAKNAKMNALGLNATGTDEGTVESNIPNALISEFKIDEPISDPKILEYIDAEIKYNQAKLTNLYVTAFNNPNDRKTIGEKLSKNAVTLTKYIIDRKKANATNDAIAVEIVPVILNETKDILEQKVYEK